MRNVTIAVSLLLATFAAGAPRDVEHDFAGARHMIFAPGAPLTEARLADIRARGIEIQQPLTDGRFIVRAARNADVAEMSVAPLGTDEKILRSARRLTGRGRTWIDVIVLFHNDVTFHDARTAVLAAGGAVDDAFATRFELPQMLNVRIAPAALDTLALDERVLVVGAEPRTPAMPLNLRAAQLSHASDVQAAPYNLSGAGQVVMVSEISEAQGDHVEYGGRVTTAGGAGDRAHSTHVTGTIAAQGIRSDAKGMAPAVRVFEYNVGRSLSSMLRALRDNLPINRAITNNTSLGFPLAWCTSCNSDLPVWLDEEEGYGSYDAIFTKPFDDLTAEQGTLLVFASGNDGDLPNFSSSGDHRHVDEDGDPIVEKVYCFSFNGSGTDCPISCSGGCEKEVHHKSLLPFDSMTITGAGKNVLAVGAVTTVTTPPTITDFSSRGPAKDGRVKPELVARGLAVLSSVPTNAYGTSQGTSMAAPVVSGISALVAEQWQKTFGTRPKPVHLRALLIAGATDLGNPGPDYTYGYGLVDAKNSVDLIIADGARGEQIVTTNLVQGATVERLITLTATQNLKVLTTWHDPSTVLLGNDSFTKKALVNDIDIRIIGPNGVEHRPYVLDKVHYEAPATRGVNNTDNTELIEIANAPPGAYRLLVTATNIAPPAGGGGASMQEVVIVMNAKAAAFAPCDDVQEPNDTEAAAYGSLHSGQSLDGAICTQNDVDFIKFEATRFGPMTAHVTATGDTPLRVTMTAANGQTTTSVIPAGGAADVTLQYGSGTSQAPALGVSVKIEAAGTIGSEPTYTLKLSFGQFVTAKRRAVR